MADNSKFVPPKGMRDWLPQETLLRQKLIRLIENQYQLYGFQPIDTPVMENIEVLQGKGGGENEKLMFKVQKRGEEYSNDIEILKLVEWIKTLVPFIESIDFSTNSSEITKSKLEDLKLAIRNVEVEFSNVELNVPGLVLDQIDLQDKFDSLTKRQKIQLLIRFIRNFENNSPTHFTMGIIRALVRKLSQEFSSIPVDISGDMGLRFDMTVPLARYYGNHANELPKPFRCYHIGPVWRADRPQKGRFREFYQCDIDIVGNPSSSCEVELLLATDRVLKALDIGKFKIRISHKELLSSVLQALGVESQFVPKIATAVDKLDKLPRDTVREEIRKSGISPDVFETIWTNVIELSLDKWGSPYFRETFSNTLLGSQIELIEKAVKEINPSANVVFDPLLVRGFDYYTGPVFEINVEDKDFTFSIGGGGRYDGLVEKLGGPKNTPAVGLSLGFERILTILMERGNWASEVLKTRVNTVYVVNDGKTEKDIQVLAENLRSHGIAVETGLEKKDKVKQFVAAQANGLEYAITDFVPGAQTFKVRQLSSRQDTEMNVEQLKARLPIYKGFLG